MTAGRSFANEIGQTVSTDQSFLFDISSEYRYNRTSSTAHGNPGATKSSRPNTSYRIRRASSAAGTAAGKRPSAVPMRRAHATITGGSTYRPSRVRHEPRHHEGISRIGARRATRFHSLKVFGVLKMWSLSAVPSLTVGHRALPAGPRLLRRFRPASRICRVATSVLSTDHRHADRTPQLGPLQTPVWILSNCTSQKVVPRNHRVPPR